MKTLNCFTILTLAFCISCSSHKKEDEIADALQKELEKIQKTEQSGDNLKGMTVDEFFEYTKNPVFLKSERVGNIEPYYSRRMMEVKVSQSPDDISEAKKLSGKGPDYVNKVSTPNRKITAEQKNKLKSLAEKLENVFMGKVKLSLPRIEDDVSNTEYIDISDENNMALTILKSHQLAFELNIEGGVPLDYVKEIAGLRNDSLFVPEYMSQLENKETNAVEHVQFIFNNIVFRIYPMDQSDYYDSQIITAAANMALLSIKSDKRYYQLDDDRNVVLATKKEIDLLCRKFGWKIKG